MEKIPTAQEWLESQQCIRNVEDFYNDVQPVDLIEFAQLHIKAAFKEIYNKHEFYHTSDQWGHERYIDEDSILNSYPLTNIK